MVKTVHLVLQGKGGVGKSLTSSMLAQYLLAQGASVTAVDTDPTNATFAAITTIGATHINIMEDGEINARRFDDLMTTVLEASDDTQIVIDTGATCFIALCSYLAQNQAFDLLEQMGAQVFVHCPVCGGAAFGDTVDGLVAILETFEGVPVVVWLNEFFGPVERDGRAFEESRIYRNHAERIVAVLRHQKVQHDTFGADVREMMERKLTFSEASNSTEFNIMARQRLKLIWRNFEQQLSGAAFLRVVHE